MTSMEDSDLDWLPNLKDFSKTSEPDPFLNCFAYAYGATHGWFDPQYHEIDVDIGITWPLPSSYGLTIQSFIELFESIGYEICEDGHLEARYEKVAIYASGSDPRHAARQMENGRWRSKLGKFQDIEHATPEEVSCYDYGEVSVFMKRLRPSQ